MLIYILLSIASGMAGTLIYLYYLQKGQFDHHEEVKYQIFRDEDPK